MSQVDPNCEDFSLPIILLGSILYGLIVLGSTILNLLLLVSILKKKGKFSSPINIYFISLAVSDILLVYSVCGEVYLTLNESYDPSDIFCKLNAFASEILLLASPLSMFAVVIERFTALHSLRKHGSTRKNTVIIIISIWIFSICIAGIVIPSAQPVQDTCGGLTCANTALGNLYRVLTYALRISISFYIPFPIMVVLYSLIIVKLRHSIVRRKALSGNTSSRSNEKSETVCNESRINYLTNIQGQTIDEHSFESFPDPIVNVRVNCVTKVNRIVDKQNRVSERRRELTQIIIIKLTVFFITWTPYITIRSIITADVSFNTIIYRISNILLLLNCVINPMITFRSSGLRKTLIEILRVFKSRITHKD